MTVGSKLHWWHYYIPLRWTVATRYINVINVISFFLIDAFPSLYIVLALGAFDIETFLFWGVAFYTMFCFYECGYIFNEVVSVRYEENPTIRIPEPYFSKIPRHLENLITVRLVIGTLGSWFLLSYYPANWKVYVLLILLLLVVYAIHNFFRGPINAVTMPLEVGLKYMIPISVFVPMNMLGTALFAVFLTIVCVRLIEYISKKRYVSWIRVTQNVDKFRVLYYLIAVTVAFLASSCGILPLGLCGLPMIFLIYRLASYFAMNHMKKVAKIIHRGREHHGTEANIEKKDV